MTVQTVNWTSSSSLATFSQLSGISIVALPAEVYVYGLQIALCMPIMTFVVLIINKVFIPVFYHNHIANCYEVSYRRRWTRTN